MMKTALGRLRFIALAEGVSYLLLLGIAMPLKYAFGMPAAVSLVGMLHGVLFVLFALALAQATLSAHWKLTFSALIFGSSLVPFGAFWMDRRLKALEPANQAVSTPRG